MQIDIISIALVILLELDQISEPRPLNGIFFNSITNIRILSRVKPMTYFEFK